MTMRETDFNEGGAFLKRCVCLGALLIAVLLFAGGCASNSAQTWNSRTGVMTVKQAVQKLGPPQKAMAFPDGYQVAEWLTRFGTRTSLTVHRGPLFAQRYLDYSILPRDVPAVPDQYIRLLFGPDGRMITWDRTSE